MVNNYWVRGIAPNANIISLKVLDKNGVGTDSGVIAAIQAAIELPSSLKGEREYLSLGQPVMVACKFDSAVPGGGRGLERGVGGDGGGGQ